MGYYAGKPIESTVYCLNNHPVRGDYNTEALIFKMATMRFLVVFEEETNKMSSGDYSTIFTEPWVIVNYYSGMLHKDVL